MYHRVQQAHPCCQMPLLSITVVYVRHVILSTACDGQQGTGAPWTSSVLWICNLKVVW